MPRSNPVLAMSREEFQVMEHRLGWKHEYIDCHAHLSLQESAVVDWQQQIDAEFAHERRLPSEMTLRAVSNQDLEALVTLFLEAFEDSIEYSGCNEDFFQQDAQDSVRSFFGMSTMQPSRQNDIGLSEASFLIERGSALIAAILVRPIRLGTIVEPIMVMPAYRRMGLSHELLNATLTTLSNTGIARIFSQSHLGNPVSCAWHSKEGFEEVPTIYAATHRKFHFDWMAKHYEHLGQAQAAHETRTLAEHWRIMCNNLEHSAYQPLI